MEISWRLYSEKLTFYFRISLWHSEVTEVDSQIMNSPGKGIQELWNLLKQQFMFDEILGNEKGTDYQIFCLQKLQAVSGVLIMN